MPVFWVILLVLGAAIIAGLAFYAGKLIWQVKAQQAEIAKAKQAHIEKRQARNVKLADSINLIARAMKEGQCEYSEGCLRIWVLMSQYYFEPALSLEAEYPNIHKMYDVVKDMPTHEARKKYSKKEIFKMDSNRWRAEKELEDGILQDAEKAIRVFPAAPGSENVVFN